MAKKKKTTKRVTKESKIQKAEAQITAEEAETDKIIGPQIAREPIDEAERQAMMSHRQRMHIQNSKAKRKFAETSIGIHKVPAELKDSLPADSEEMVQLTLPFKITVNHKGYGPGKVTVPKHLARTIEPMVYKKQQAELSIFVGKNYRVQKIGGKTIRTEVGSAGLDLKALVEG